jgi:cytochrome c peroxidase
MKCYLRTCLLATTVLVFSPGLIHAAATDTETAEHDPAEIAIGERLFLETRFAQAYYAQPGTADPLMAHTRTTKGQLPGPFAGQTMNCRACHMVDEHRHSAGMRSYADYAARSPVPAREDGLQHAERNAMSMVNIALPREPGVLFHFDGEFNSLEDLVRGTLSGRNFGWLPDEEQTAIAHVARVIRDDNGTGELAQEFGGSYRKILKGSAKDIPAELRLPTEYRIDVDKADDQQIFDAVARLVATYVRDLGFARDEQGNYTGSPYDRFLQANNLPRQAANAETAAAYGQRLLKAVESLKTPRFISAQAGSFATHNQTFRFGPTELQGMKLFFRRGSEGTPGGNCNACHNAPHFSDFRFHNTGMTQHNYDALHGSGAFARLAIPDLKQRNQQPGRYLPATAQHPETTTMFRRPAARDQPGQTDLGLWNVYANADMPGPQHKLQAILCQQAKQQGLADCSKERLLPLAIAAFKTPVLRDLGHSAPYMHNGQFDSLQSAVEFYIASSALARQAGLRNADPALQHIHISAPEVEALTAFLRALNEDYD